MSQFISFTDRPFTKKELKRIERFHVFFTGKKLPLIPRVSGLKSVLRATVETEFFTKMREGANVAFKGSKGNLSKKRIEDRIREYDLHEVAELRLPYKVYRTFRWMLSLLGIDEVDYLSDLGIHVDVVRTKNFQHLTNCWSFQEPRYTLQSMHDFPDECPLKGLTKGEQYWIADMADRNWCQADGEILLDLWVSLDNLWMSEIVASDKEAIVSWWTQVALESSKGSFDHMNTLEGIMESIDRKAVDLQVGDLIFIPDQDPDDTLTAEG